RLHERRVWNTSFVAGRVQSDLCRREVYARCLLCFRLLPPFKCDRRLTMRWSERPPAVRSRQEWLGHLHYNPPLLSVAVAHLFLVRAKNMSYYTGCELKINIPPDRTS